jgi:hypothetical protein
MFILIAGAKWNQPADHISGSRCTQVVGYIVLPTATYQEMVRKGGTRTAVARRTDSCWQQESPIEQNMGDVTELLRSFLFTLPAQRRRLSPDDLEDTNLGIG